MNELKESNPINNCFESLQEIETEDDWDPVIKKLDEMNAERIQFLATYNAFMSTMDSDQKSLKKDTVSSSTSKKPIQITSILAKCTFLVNFQFQRDINLQSLQTNYIFLKV